MSKPFIKKYEPQKLSGIIGQADSIKQLTAYIRDYKSMKKKGALIFGPSGVGKTISVYAIANHLNLEIIEVNASDFRNKDKINMVIGNALKQGSLFGKSKLILIDEVDGISGTKDRGAIQEVIALMKKSSYPIILTAQNPFENKFSTLRNNTQMIGFKELDYKDVFIILKEICIKEKNQI